MTSKPIARPRDIIGHKGDKDRAEMQVFERHGAKAPTKAMDSANAAVHLGCGALAAWP